MPGAPHTRKDFEHLIDTDYDDMHVNDVQQVMMNNGAYRWQIQCTCNVCGMKRNFLSLNFMNHAGTTHKYCHHNDKDKYNYLRGQKFDDVIVENVYGKYFGKQGPYWMASCKCTVCGKVRDIFISELLKPNRHSGRHIRCYKGLKYPRQFMQLFYNIRKRCTDPNNKSYPDYGGRGIKCEWDYLDQFANDMLESYTAKCNEIGSSNVSIERLDVNGNYCKENCTWMSRDFQRYNKTNTIYFKATSPEGKVYYGSRLRMFCRKLNISESVMYNALDSLTHKATNGWYIVRISKETYEDYLVSLYNVPADVDYLVDTLHGIYTRCIQNGIHVSTDGDEVSCSKTYLESTVLQRIDPDVINAICSIENKYNLIIDFNPKANSFRMYKSKDDVIFN